MMSPICLLGTARGRLGSGVYRGSPPLLWYIPIVSVTSFNFPGWYTDRDTQQKRQTLSKTHQALSRTQMHYTLLHTWTEKHPYQTLTFTVLKNISFPYFQSLYRVINIYTGWKGNKCHPFNSRRGRFKGPKNIYIYNMGSKLDSFLRK